MGVGDGWRRGWWGVELLKDTFECDIVAFQRLLFRQSERELQTREDEGACNPKRVNTSYSRVGMRPLRERSVREGPPGRDAADMKGACNPLPMGQRRSLKPGRLKGRDVAGLARNLPPLGHVILKPGVLILFQLSNHPPLSPLHSPNLIHPEIRLRGVKSRLVLKQFLGVFGVFTRGILHFLPQEV